jgi:hypothetical protein
MELWKGVPANWMVLVVGVTVDWAFAEKVANAIKTTRQNKAAADFPRTPDLFCANDTAVVEGLTLGLPCLDNLWLPSSLTDVKKASSNCLRNYRSMEQNPEVLRNHCSQEQFHMEHHC